MPSLNKLLASHQLTGDLIAHFETTRGTVYELSNPDIQSLVYWRQLRGLAPQLGHWPVLLERDRWNEADADIDELLNRHKERSPDEILADALQLDPHELLPTLCEPPHLAMPDPGWPAQLENLFADGDSANPLIAKLQDTLKATLERMGPLPASMYEEAAQELAAKRTDGYPADQALLSLVQAAQQRDGVEDSESVDVLADDLWPEAQDPGIDWYEPRSAATLLLIPTTTSWEVPALLGYGGGELDPTVHVCLAKHWADIYGAELLQLGSTSCGFSVPQLLSDRMTALRVAWEHYAYTFGEMSYPSELLQNARWLLKYHEWWLHWYID